MGWRGENQRDADAEWDFKNRPWRERNIFGRVTFMIAVVAFFVLWVAASFR